MTALVINVKEDRGKVAAWKKELKWSIPVLLDTDGAYWRFYTRESVEQLLCVSG